MSIVRHARCPICQPQLAFVPFTAICGECGVFPWGQRT